MSWHNMGLNEDWRGDSDALPSVPDLEAEARKARLEAYILEDSAKLEVLRAERQAALDAESHQSLAHKAKAEEDFGYFPKNAAEVANNGWSKFLVRGCADGSVLVFQVGEMGIEEVNAFTTHEEAVAWGNTVGIFE